MNTAYPIRISYRYLVCLHLTQQHRRMLWNIEYEYFVLEAERRRYKSFVRFLAVFYGEWIDRAPMRDPK